MKIHHYGFALLVLLGILGSNQQAQAYFTTAQSAVALSSTTALFTITYTFGSPTKELYMPIAAVRDLTVTANNKDLSYTLVDRNGSSTSVGTMNGLVLSTAQIKDNQYYLPVGTAGKFVLVALVTTQPDTPMSKYKLQVTALPFTMVTKGEPRAQRLMPTELDYYVTPPVTLNKTATGPINPPTN